MLIGSILTRNAIVPFKAKQPKRINGSMIQDTIYKDGNADACLEVLYTSHIPVQNSGKTSKDRNEPVMPLFV